MGSEQDEARFQRIESLLEIFRAQSSLSSHFSGPVIMNEAAASALVGLPDGAQVFILTHRSIWTKRVGTPGVQGVPPLSAHEVITSADPAGVLCRTDYSDPALRIGINDIFIDPANPAADDENDGLTALTPLQSGKELFRRWGWGSNPEVGPNLATSPDGFTTVHINSDIIAPDYLSFVFTLAADVSFRVVGSTTTTRTGSLTAAPTAMDRATNTRLRLTDAGASPFAAADIGKRGRFTNGPAFGGTFMPERLVGAGVVDCSPCQTTNEPGFSVAPITVTPANGNAYVIEQLARVNWGDIVVCQGNQPSFGVALMNIVDVETPASTGPLVPITGDSLQLNFYNCVFRRVIEPSKIGLSDLAGLILIACYFTEGIQQAKASTAAFLRGGGAVRVAGTTLPAIYWATSLQAGIDNDFVSEGMPVILIGDASVGNAAVFNAALNAPFNPGGHGFLVGASTTVQSARARVTFRGTAWGNGSAGAGIRIASGCDGVGGTQIVTGVAGDLLLASSALGWWWNTATGVYNPVGAGIALTWANIAAAKGAAGFGGVAHNPDQDAHWITAETN